MMTGTNKLEAQSLACRRGARDVFSGLDFTLQSGAALIVTGPNGSGKSSLLRMIAGLLSSVSGTLQWDGADVKRVEGWPGNHLHYAGHQMALKPVLSVAENIRFWAGFYDKSANIDMACHALGLENLMDLPVQYLSEGQKRRTALARLVAIPLPVWLLDEPTVGLDRETTGRLENLINGHLNDGGMVIAATHTPIQIDNARTLQMGQAS